MGNGGYPNVIISLLMISLLMISYWVISYRRKEIKIFSYIKIFFPFLCTCTMKKCKYWIVLYLKNAVFIIFFKYISKIYIYIYKFIPRFTIQNTHESVFFPSEMVGNQGVHSCTNWIMLYMSYVDVLLPIHYHTVCFIKPYRDPVYKCTGSR